MWCSGQSAGIGRKPATRLWKAAAVAALAGSFGCSSLLDVSLPGNIPASQLDDPGFADVLTRSVIAEYECALSEHAGAQGLFGTEMRQSGNLAGRDHFHNRIEGNVQGASDCSGASVVFGTSGAQFIAMAYGRDVARRYEARTDAEQPNRLRHLATATIYTAYAVTIFGQGYCSAVFEANGTEQTPKQMQAIAETWFTNGLTAATTLGDANLINLARLGRARVRNYLGNSAGAIADATVIPNTFSVDGTRAATPLTRNNRIYGETWRDRHVTIHPSFYNLAISNTTGRFVPLGADATADPRVQVVQPTPGAKGTDGTTDAWYPNKANAAQSPTRMASYAEAQLIIAEGRIRQATPDLPAAYAAINAARARRTIVAYTPVAPTDAVEALNTLLEERRRELFLEGFWTADMIRYPGRSMTQWDEGLNHQGQGTYRALYCIPLSERERTNNPNL
ncbi:MAG: RagB/SusD family nutrient uptake outer membrane protein [Gemmatimonadetes bacterium]|nr:RagB/SusD family nutrient uptake outer membrane protein [Gemmatimonadota bacterium]